MPPSLAGFSIAQAQDLPDPFDREFERKGNHFDASL